MRSSSDFSLAFSYLPNFSLAAHSCAIPCIIQRQGGLSRNYSNNSGEFLLFSLFGGELAPAALCSGGFYFLPAVVLGLVARAILAVAAWAAAATRLAILALASWLGDLVKDSPKEGPHAARLADPHEPSSSVLTLPRTSPRQGAGEHLASVVVMVMVTVTGQEAALVVVVEGENV